MRRGAALSAICTICMVYIYFGRREQTSDKEVWDISGTIDYKNVNNRNCSLRTCWKLLHCIRDFTKVRIYVQPLITIYDNNGVKLTPDPSREFLEIRERLRALSKTDEHEACAVLPGVDFLNTNRFTSQKSLFSVLRTLETRVPNGFLVNILGPTSELFNSKFLIISPLPERSIFREGYDISIFKPLRGSPVDLKGEDVKRSIWMLAPLFNMSSVVRATIQQNIANIKGLLVVVECEENPMFVCDVKGQKLSEGLDSLIKKSWMLLVHGRMTAFRELLSKALAFNAVPIILDYNFKLPLKSEIDWHRISIIPWSLEQLARTMVHTSKEELTKMRWNGNEIFETHFRSLDNVLMSSLTTLENNILPHTSGISLLRKSAKNTCVSGRAHISPSIALISIFEMKSQISTQYFNAVCSSAVLLESLVLWREETIESPMNIWSCGVKEVTVVSGDTSQVSVSDVMRWIETRDAVECVFLVPEDVCEFDPTLLTTAFNIWRASPHSLIRLPRVEDDSGTQCQPAGLIHKNAVLCNNFDDVLSISQMLSNASNLLNVSSLQLVRGPLKQSAHSLHSFEDRVLI